MRYFKTGFRVVFFALIALILHYTLPQHDIAQISQAESRRTDFGSFNRWFYSQPDGGNAELVNRDVFYISTEKKETFLLGFIPRDRTEVMVYRNEDTGWGWPFYFKFDSANLNAQAAAQARLTTGDNWVVITHYGWRIPFLSIYPNAVGIRPVDSPDVRIIPWFNIFFFVFIGLAALFTRAMWRQLWERSIDPVLDAAGHRMDEAQAGISARRSRLNRWWRKDK